jgi:methionyl-tRNA formyltransferase
MARVCREHINGPDGNGADEDAAEVTGPFTARAEGFAALIVIIKRVSTGLRIVIASYGSLQFRFLQETLTAAGHVPVAYLMSRSMRPSGAAEPDLLAATTAVVADVPPGMDLLLPGSADTVADMLTGYRPDLLLVFGFNWRLPREVLELPRLGVLNVHPSALPRYRGPSPVLWAIRNGDPRFMGVTVHRMTARFDAGPVLAQVDDIPVPDQVTSRTSGNSPRPSCRSCLRRPSTARRAGDPGAPQDEREATYAGFPPPDWYQVSVAGQQAEPA